MPCQEFSDAINWIKQSSDQGAIVYFTRHLGVPIKGMKDIVHFASGPVLVKDTPTPHLKGTLQVSKNTDVVGQMVSDAAQTYDVEIYPDGKVTYLLKVNGQPAGGNPAATLQATCFKNALLTGEHEAMFGPEIVTVGVDRKKGPGPVPG